MKKLKLTAILLLISALLLNLAGCGKADEESGKDKMVINVGTSPGPYSELFLDAVKPILEDKGFTVKTTDFSDLLQADVALADGGVDLNVDQHTAYMKNFNENKNAELISLTPIPTVPAGIFPGKKTSLDDVEKGDTVGIPNDASNAARAYALLQKAGWIKLDDDVELVKATAQDIKENPYDLKIVEMDSAQIPRSLQDFAYGVIPGSMVYAADMDASLSLLPEDVLKDLELVAVINQTNKDSKWAQAVIDAYHSDEFKAYMKEHNQDDYWFIPEELK
ncbi:MetQ/NlpA family ABC transporter substrate-binding protein [Bhargavaea cecembensis]|uniref:MetQ/NlpA family ABC transporter substrate-binding protein n=1 Tax=Bhargavaea cecembensis TaxID=394098 RepID=UPI0005910ADA|nr:MetQ/NlpA family ABC transporter substrate-binding protein [Bhargavaea cecembensis]